MCLVPRWVTVAMGADTDLNLGATNFAKKNLGAPNFVLCCGAQHRNGKQ